MKWILGISILFSSFSLVLAQQTDAGVGTNLVPEEVITVLDRIQEADGTERFIQYDNNEQRLSVWRSNRMGQRVQDFEFPDDGSLSHETGTLSDRIQRMTLIFPRGCGKDFIGARLIPGQPKLLLLFRNSREVLVQYAVPRRRPSRGASSSVFALNEFHVLYDNVGRSGAFVCEFNPPTFERGQALVESIDTRGRRIHLSRGSQIPLDGYEDAAGENFPCIAVDQAMLQTWSRLRGGLVLADFYPAQIWMNVVAYRLRRFYTSTTDADHEELMTVLRESTIEDARAFFSARLQAGGVLPLPRAFNTNLRAESLNFSIRGPVHFCITSRPGVYRFRHCVSLNFMTGQIQRTTQPESPGMDRLGSVLWDSWSQRISSPFDFMEYTYTDENQWRLFERERPELHLSQNHFAGLRGVCLRRRLALP